MSTPDSTYRTLDDLAQASPSVPSSVSEACRASVLT